MSVNDKPTLKDVKEKLEKFLLEYMEGDSLAPIKEAIAMLDEIPKVRARQFLHKHPKEAAKEINMEIFGEE